MRGLVSEMAYWQAHVSSAMLMHVTEDPPYKDILPYMGIQSKGKGSLLRANNTMFAAVLMR